MNFWPFKTSQGSTAPQQNKIEELKPTKSFSKFQIYQQQFQEFLNNNMPVGFSQKLERTNPYILASFVAWPLFWLYRGLEWSNQRANNKLHMYIHKTYLQAKFMQFSIIMFGLTVASLMENIETEITENSNNQIKP